MKFLIKILFFCFPKFVQNLFKICAYTYTLKTLILIYIKLNNN